MSQETDNREQKTDVQPIVVVDRVSKVFKLPHDRKTSLKSAVVRFGQRGYELQKTLDDVSFEIQKGEFFGIVGRNGSGKSTLLKIIAGIYTPTDGQIKVNGSLAPFIELGVGFNPELTGRENVYLNGALLGFSRQQMNEKYDEIVSFAELERFMDQKLKNYSSGMQVRLAFSIAIQAKADILLLDEVLAVGDAAFQQKCNDYFASLKRDKQTIILVSHSMPAIERYCTRALLLENSRIKKIGSPSEIAGLYEDMLLKEEADKADQRIGSRRLKSGPLEADVKIRQANKAAKSLQALKPFEIEVELKSSKPIDKASIGLSLKNSEGEIVMAVESQDYIGSLKVAKNKPVKISVKPANYYTNGLYYLTLSINDDNQPVPYGQLAKWRDVASFSIFGIRKNANSLVHPPVEVSLTKGQ